MSIEQSKISLGNLQIDEMKSINKLLEQKDTQEVSSKSKSKVKRGITITLIAIISFAIILLTNFTIDVYLTYLNIANSNQMLAYTYILIYFIAISCLVVYLIYTINSYSNLKNAFFIQNKTANCNGYEEEKKVALLILDHYQKHHNPEVIKKSKLLEKKLNDNSVHSPFQEIKTTIINDLDKEAIRTTYASAKEVSIFTAFSSSSAIDSILVIFSSIKLMKKVFLVYGYRTNFFTSLLIYRKIIENASLSALMEYADDSVVDVLGNSLFSKVSVKIAQGIGNGVLILRIGNMLVQSARPFASNGSTGAYRQMVKIFYQFIKDKVVKK